MYKIYVKESGKIVNQNKADDYRTAIKRFCWYIEDYKILLGDYEITIEDSETGHVSAVIELHQHR